MFGVELSAITDLGGAVAHDHVVYPCREARDVARIGEHFSAQSRVPVLTKIVDGAYRVNAWL